MINYWIKRKNVTPFVVMIGIVTWLVVLEPATVVQLVVKPTLNGADCTCSVNPVWAEGQASVRFVPPVTVGVIVTELETAVSTFTEPFTFSLEVSHVTV